MGRSAQKCPSSILKAWRETIARNGGKAYTDAVTQILSKNAQAEKTDDSETEWTRVR